MQILFRNLCKQFTCVECFTSSRFCSHWSDTFLCMRECSVTSKSSVRGISQARVLELFLLQLHFYVGYQEISQYLLLCFKGSALVWTLIFLTQKSVYYCYQGEEHSIRLEICSSLGNRFVAWVRNWYMMLFLPTRIALCPWETFVCLTAKY